ncbi:Crp/Fnr family transcriptional regulator [Leptolyngbya sp. FACHB-261]|uniref:Crp/Fnr family transcriptional regulator n=1 Tax=Leptolyngbya sp. FACHB-261 TaxID=2692806 RepID=UPI00168318DD|nr:Crp/Fnr family transcriptional regulator [Leptolyngbya sp. FACHB-261]MBD2104714.1 Crp/Fnr family transcriptional regulator [Leptolyngbya sp. FACHB-261]
MSFLSPDSLSSNVRAAITYQDLVPGQALFQQGDPTAAMFGVESGRVRLSRNTSEGKLVTFQVIRAGESFAEAALFSETYTSDAIAEIQSRVAIYPKQLLVTAFRENPDLTEDFVVQLVRSIQVLQSRLELRDVRSAHQRVLQYLRIIAEPNDTNLVIFDRPLKDVANDLGLTPETLSRALGRLEHEGVISRAKRQIRLHDSAVA